MSSKNPIQKAVIALLNKESFSFYGSFIQKDGNIIVGVFALDKNRDVVGFRFFSLSDKTHVNWYDGRPVSKDGSSTFRLGIDYDCAIVSPNEALRGVTGFSPLDGESIEFTYSMCMDATVRYAMGEEGIEKNERQFFAFPSETFKIDHLIDQ